MAYITKNYKENNGDRSVIGGELHITDDAILSKGNNSIGAFLTRFKVAAASATATSATGIHAAVTSTASPSVVITEITNPSTPRNITATAGGTVTDIKAIAVIIEGTNFNDEVITETLPVFTVDTAGSVAGSKAFKTVTKVTIPAHDGVLATTSIGFGEILGLPAKLDHNTVLKTYLGNVVETTAPTVTVSSTVLENNTIDLNSALNGSVVDVYLIQ